MSTRNPMNKRSQAQQAGEISGFTRKSAGSAKPARAEGMSESKQIALLEAVAAKDKEKRGKRKAAKDGKDGK